MSPHRRTTQDVPLIPAMASGVQTGSTMPPFFAIVVLIAGVVGGLVFIVAIIVLCKYCVRNGAHLKITLCWLRRRNVGRFLGQYGSLDCVASGSGAVASGKSVSSELTVGAGDDDLGSPGGSGGPSLGGWRRKHRPPQRQSSTVQAIVTPPPVPLDDNSPPINVKFTDDSCKANIEHDVNNKVGQFTELSGTCRDHIQGNSSSHNSCNSGLDNRKKTAIATTGRGGGVKVLHTVSASDEIGSEQVDTSQSVRRVSFVLNTGATRSLTDGAESFLQRWPTDSDCHQSKSFADRRSSSVTHHHGSSSLVIETDIASPSIVNSRTDLLTSHAAVILTEDGGKNRRHLSVMPQGMMAARRSLPTPTTTMMTPTATFEGSRSASSNTNGTRGKSVEMLADVEIHRTPDAGPLAPPIVTSIRRRSYASAGTSRGTSGGNTSTNGGGSVAMTHSKSIWLSPASCFTAKQSDQNPHANGDRRLSISGVRRASASLEISPFQLGKANSTGGAAPSKMHQRVRSCDVDPGGEARSNQRSQTTAATAMMPPVARKSPPVSRHFLTDSESPTAVTGSPTSSGTATHLSKPTVTTSSNSVSITTAPRATLKVRYPGISGTAIGRVPRYNDPGSFEEVNEDLLYNKLPFGDGEDTPKKSGQIASAQKHSSTSAVNSVDHRSLNANDNSMNVSIGSGVTNRPSSPNCLVGDSVQRQYRELWDLRATIAEQECYMAIRLEAASSPEPEKVDEENDATASNSYGITGSHYSVPINGDRLSLPISRRQIYRNVVERRLSQRQGGSTSISDGGLIPVANCSVDSFETDGDMSNSDTSRHDVTTSFESSTTTTTTTDNNTDCLSDARNSLETASLYNKTGSGRCLDTQRSPTSSMAKRANLADTKVVSGLLTTSQCSSSFDDTSCTNANEVVTSANSAENSRQLTSRVTEHQRIEPATDALRSQPSRYMPSCSSGNNSTMSTNRTAAKKRRDFRKCDRIDDVQINGSYPAGFTATAPSNGPALFNGSYPAGFTATAPNNGPALFGSDSVRQATSDAGVSRDGREGDFRKHNAQSPSCFAPMKPLLSTPRKAPSTVDNFRASMSNRRYGRHAEASSGFRDYSVDERTNAVYNEFLRHDRSLDCGYFMHHPDGTGGGGQGSSSPYRHHRHHQHQRSHHHNPLHNHRWRHRVYCTTGSPPNVDTTAASTSGVRAFVTKSPGPQFTGERQYSQPSQSSSLSLNATRTSSGGFDGSAAAALGGVARRPPAGGGQSTGGTNGGLPLTGGIASEPSRRRPPPIEIVVVASSQNQNSTSIDEDSPKSFASVDRTTSSVTSMTH